MGGPGRLLASGRDADIYEHGAGLVLRRARGGRSLAAEAQIMEYLHAQGFPVPAVESLGNGGADLVMERVDGPTMVEALSRAPWTVRRQGAVLADLHRRLHDLVAPGFLPPAPVGHGDRIVHLDLHPLNVILGSRGPVVIDWTNAARGDPAADVALAWVLMAAGEIPGGGLKAKLLGRGRAMLVSSFVAAGDRRAAAAARLRDVVTWKEQDPHMSRREVAAMWQVVQRAEDR